MTPRTIMLAADQFFNDLEDRGVRDVAVVVTIAPDVELSKGNFTQIKCTLPPAAERVLQLEAELAQCKADLAAALGAAVV